MTRQELNRRRDDIEQAALSEGTFEGLAARWGIDKSTAYQFCYRKGDPIDVARIAANGVLHRRNSRLSRAAREDLAAWRALGGEMAP